MNHPGVKWGLYLGGLSIFLTTLFKFINPKLIFSVPLGILIGFIVPIIFMVISGKEMRALLENFMSFGEALKNSMIVIIIGTFLGTMYDYFMINIFDPSLLEVQKEVIAEWGNWTMDMMEGMGAPEEQLDEQRDQFEKQSDIANNMSFGQAFSGWLFTLLIWLIPAMIVSAIIKKTN